MSDRKFDSVVASEKYQSAVAALTEAQLKTIATEGVRIYAGIHDAGFTHVALSPGNDERGAYSEVVVDQFESGRWEYVYIDPEMLACAMDGSTFTVRECLEESCSYDADALFEKVARG